MWSRARPKKQQIRSSFKYTLNYGKTQNVLNFLKIPEYHNLYGQTKFISVLIQFSCRSLRSENKTKCDIVFELFLCQGHNLNHSAVCFHFWGQSPWSWSLITIFVLSSPKNLASIFKLVLPEYKI